MICNSGRMHQLWEGLSLEHRNSQNGRIGNFQSPFIDKKQQIEVTKMFKIDFLGTLGTNQKLVATRGTHAQKKKKKKIWLSVRELCGIVTYPDCISCSQPSVDLGDSRLYSWYVGTSTRRSMTDLIRQELRLFVLTCLVPLWKIIKGLASILPDLVTSFSPLADWITGRRGCVWKTFKGKCIQGAQW